MAHSFRNNKKDFSRDGKKFNRTAELNQYADTETKINFRGGKTFNVNIDEIEDDGFFRF